MAVSLWKQNDVGALISLSQKCHVISSPSDEEWKEIEGRVLERVAQLPLPKPLKRKVSCFVQSVGLQIYEWTDFHCRRYHLHVNLPLELCWTPQGTVDRKRTAEVLVKDESLDLSTRYKLACVYCFEEDVMALWNTLSEHLKQSFLFENPPNIREWHGKRIISFWSRTMRGRGLGHALISYKEGFVNCAREGNKAAAEYFLQKLTPRERGECLVEAAKYVEDADTLCFLLSKIEDEQQMEVFKGNPVGVLYCFLQWPWQSFFMEVAHCVWDFISKKDYDCTLMEIIYKVTDGYKDWNYPKLFREFWQKSPDALKIWIANDLDKRILLPCLFASRNKEMVRLILQDATPTAREELIHNNEVNVFCQCSIRDDKWDYLQFCIRECFPSKGLMSKFKKEFQKSGKWKSVEGNIVRNRDRWDRLFLSSEDSLREYEKRSADEGESRSSKRFRSLE